MVDALLRESVHSMNEKPSPKVTFSDLRLPEVGEIFAIRENSLRTDFLVQYYQSLPNGQAVLMNALTGHYFTVDSLEPVHVLTIS